MYDIEYVQYTVIYSTIEKAIYRSEHEKNKKNCSKGRKKVYKKQCIHIIIRKREGGGLDKLEKSPE